MNQTDVYQGPSSAARPASSASTDDPRVLRAMEGYLAAQRAGHAPSRADLLARHADIAPALALCVDGLEFIQEAARQLSQPGVTANATPAGDEIQPEQPLGDFRIVREIGRGGMGVVYEAVQISLGRRVALKVLPFASTLDSRQQQRFKNEAQAAACLHHTNIVPVYATGVERGVHFYAMQFIEGQSLAGVIVELKKVHRRGAETAEKTAESNPEQQNETARNQATLPLSSLRSLRLCGKDLFRTIAELGIQAAEALEYAHQMGIVHRDIKPANLMVGNRQQAIGNRTSPDASCLMPIPSLWITDFGLAQVQNESTRLTLTGDLLGTLRYMSPEQALAQRVIVDHRTDIYSLGVTLYELLTLQPAFDGKDRQEILRQIAWEEPKAPRKVNRAIPAELETIVLKAMEKGDKDPDSRGCKRTGSRAGPPIPGQCARGTS